jgi:hypothetical protein
VWRKSREFHEQVSIGYTPDGLGFQSRELKDIFLFSKISSGFWGQTSLLFEDTGLLSWG